MTARDRLSLGVVIASIVATIVVLVSGERIEALLVERAGSASRDDIEVVVATPFPAPGEDLELAITDTVPERGRFPTFPMRIHAVYVRGNDEPLQQLTLERGKTMLVRVSQPEQVLAGTMPLQVDVEYSRLGGHPMYEIRSATRVDLDVGLYGASERFWAQLSVAGRAWGVFLVWFLVVLALARRYDTAGGGWTPGHRVCLSLAFLCAVVVGDAVFAQPLLISFGQNTAGWRALAALLWIGLPPMWLWIQAHRRPALGPWLPEARLRDHPR